MVERKRVCDIEIEDRYELRKLCSLGWNPSCAKWVFYRSISDQHKEALANAEPDVYDTPLS